MHCLMELIEARRFDYITRLAVGQPPGKTGSRRFIRRVTDTFAFCVFARRSGNRGSPDTARKLTVL